MNTFCFANYTCKISLQKVHLFNYSSFKKKTLREKVKKKKKEEELAGSLRDGGILLPLDRSISCLSRIWADGHPLSVVPVRRAEDYPTPAGFFAAVLQFADIKIHPLAVDQRVACVRLGVCLRVSISRCRLTPFIPPFVHRRVSRPSLIGRGNYPIAQY